MNRYEDDVLAWTQVQAALLRTGDFAALDAPNIAEEIESLGLSQKRELRSRLAGLARHLLTWRFMPELRTRIWISTILDQRIELEWLLESSPSLRATVGTMLPSAYAKGRRVALAETGLFHLPEECPFTVAQMLDSDWMPE